MNEYQEQILDHYHSPRNFGKPLGWIPTHTAKLQNLSCGDEIEVFLLVENNIIKQINFIGEGCSISIASSSLLTELLLKKPVEFLKNYSNNNIIELLGIKLSPTRIKCAVLSLETAKSSIN